MSTNLQITTRDDLIAALHEAAEIEHGLLLQYLFAALSLKQSPNENVNSEQFSLVRTWKGVILGIAVDEMGHLGTVNNLLAAIGVSPHFDRPEFPQSTGYYVRGLTKKIKSVIRRTDHTYFGDLINYKYRALLPFTRRVAPRR